MAELTAADIKVWNGTAWVTGFNVYDGSSWNNIDDGKVNVRGADGNWYKKGGGVLVDTIYPSTIALSNFHFDKNDTSWANVRSASTGNYNPSPIFTSYLSGIYYVISRGVIRFDFSSVTPVSFSSAKIVLIRNTGGVPYNFNTEPRAYRLDNDGVLTGADYDNFTTNYSDVRGIINDINTITIDLNSAAVSDLSAAITGGSVFTFMLRDYHDAENIAPTADIENGEYDYALSKLELYS